MPDMHRQGCSGSKDALALGHWLVEMFGEDSEALVEEWWT